MSSDVLIQLQHVSKCFPVFDKPQDRLKQFVVPRIKRFILPFRPANQRQYFREFWALKNISFDVECGEFVGIIGCNGSGKSTLLQIICGILQSDTGSVRVDGRIAALLELGAGFNPEFTGRENVYLNASILGLSEAEISERFDDIVEFSGIGEFIDRPVKTYSSGMFVRLAFSVATSVSPDLLIVDEALSVGDIGFSMKCMQRIDELRTKGVTVILVTHDVNLVRSMCSRVIYLKDRECAFDGDAETATELYLMDMRSTQVASLNQTMGFLPAFNPESLAFGTGNSRLVSASISCAGEARTWFRYGENVDISLQAWVSESLKKPGLAIAIRDKNGVVISGVDSRRAKNDLSRDNHGMLECVFSINRMRLLPGHYNLAVRILDFPYGSSDVLIEKQLNAVIFEVIGDSTVPIGTHGFVELECVCE